MSTSLATLPTRDLVDYCDLPDAVRNEAMAWHGHFVGIKGSGRKINPQLRDLASCLGTPFKTVRNKFYKWDAAEQDWRACVNRAKSGGERTKLTKEFINWFVRHAGKFQRNSEAAHRDFARRWKAGEEIPGLDPDLPRHRLPEGCTAVNLSRHLQRHKAALTALRRGLGVARSQGPFVLTTRAGLWTGSHVAIDDVWHDHFVMWQGQLVRVLQLSALDVFSGCLTAWGTKPRFQKADGTFDNLKEKYARLVLADHFSRHGYSPRGTQILAELGTAAVSDLAREVMERHSGGLITVRTSGITGEEQALLGLGKGSGKGNFRFKTWLESLHNLIHNELASLPAQTGKDIDHRPEFTHGQLAEDQNLIRAARWLMRCAPAKAALLESRTLHYHGHFLPLLGAVLESINRRGEDPEIWTHALEGWVAAGHVVNEFRFSADTDQWLGETDLGRMEPVARDAFLGLAGARRELCRERLLSPREVWTRGRNDLVKLPDVAVAEMLGDDFGREERVDKFAFRFQDAELAPEALEFEARILTPRGFEEELPNAETFKLLLNPFNLACVYVHDAKGRFLGTARRAQRVCRTDEAAVQEQFKRVSQRWADVLKPVRKADIAYLSAETRRVQANTDLVAGELAAQGIRTPAQLKRAEQAEHRAGAPERAAAENVRRFEGGTEDFRETEMQPVPTAEEDFDAQSLLYSHRSWTHEQE